MTGMAPKRKTQIHTWAERKVDDQYVAMPIHPFVDQSYAVFAFLGGVRNYATVQPIAEGREMPEDVSGSVADIRSARHSDTYAASWVSVEELATYPYDTAFEDRRALRLVNGAPRIVTTDPGKGIMTTVRAFLDPRFFHDLDDLIERKADRVVFWFRG